jgi:hypothetical protein
MLPDIQNKLMEEITQKAQALLQQAHPERPSPLPLRNFLSPLMKLAIRHPERGRIRNRYPLFLIRTSRETPGQEPCRQALLVRVPYLTALSSTTLSIPWPTTAGHSLASLKTPRMRVLHPRPVTNPRLVARTASSRNPVLGQEAT